jgi:Ferric reductase like transmembrane component
VVAATTIGHGKALWYLTRGTGLVSLILLSASVVLGVLQVSRWSSVRWPRFVTASLHKNVSLLVTVFLAVHIVTSIVDAFAPIGWLDVIVPFASKYRPIWLGLGAVAVDLLLAITVTSLLRQRLGYFAWRVVHWFSYACWPVAFVHGLGTGTDTKVGWVLVLNLACLGAILGAVWWRLVAGWRPTRLRISAAVVSAVAPAVTLGWLVSGPMRQGWAARAGTPATQLAAAQTVQAAGSGLQPPFNASLSGTVTQTGPDAGGNITVTITGILAGGSAGANGSVGSIRIVLHGPPDASGGVQMASSTVSLGTTAQPGLYRGQVGSLNGTDLTATVAGTNGQQLTLTVSLQVDPAGSRVSGSVRAETKLP